MVQRKVFNVIDEYGVATGFRLTGTSIFTNGDLVGVRDIETNEIGGSDEHYTKAAGRLLPGQWIVETT